MDKLFNDLIKCKRFNKNGKKEFVKKIKQWSDANLSNFDFFIQQNYLVFNIREVFIILFLFINSVILFFMLNSIHYQYRLITDIMLLLLIYIIEFRLIFLFLTIFIPSNNIILSKKSPPCNSKIKEVIICAHYDTKNSILKRKKGILLKGFKYNIYNVSRIIGKFVWVVNTKTYIFLTVIYLWFFINYSNNTKTVFLFMSYPNVVYSFIYDLAFTLIVCSLICVIIIYFSTYSFCKDTVNPGADDNTSGVVGTLEIAKGFNDIDVGFDLKVILFDNEEKGLIGSNHYAVKNYASMKNKGSKIINLDCIGRGDNILICANNSKSEVLECMSTYMEQKNIHYSFYDMDFSDHKPFVQAGLDAISIGRYNLKRYLIFNRFPVIDWIHDCEDSTEHISYEKLNEVIGLVTNSLILISRKKQSE